LNAGTRAPQRPAVAVCHQSLSSWIASSARDYRGRSLQLCPKRKVPRRRVRHRAGCPHALVCWHKNCRKKTALSVLSCLANVRFRGALAAAPQRSWSRARPVGIGQAVFPEQATESCPGEQAFVAYTRPGGVGCPTADPSTVRVMIHVRPSVGQPVPLAPCNA